MLYYLKNTYRKNLFIRNKKRLQNVFTHISISFATHKILLVNFCTRRKIWQICVVKLLFTQHKIAYPKKKCIQVEIQ